MFKHLLMKIKEQHWNIMKELNSHIMRKLSLWHKKRLNQKGVLRFTNNKNATCKKRILKPKVY